MFEYNPGYTVPPMKTAISSPVTTSFESAERTASVARSVTSASSMRPRCGSSIERYRTHERGPRDSDERPVRRGRLLDGVTRSRVLETLQAYSASRSSRRLDREARGGLVGRPPRTRGLGQPGYRSPRAHRASRTTSTEASDQDRARGGHHVQSRPCPCARQRAACRERSAGLERESVVNVCRQVVDRSTSGSSWRTGRAAFRFTAPTGRRGAAPGTGLVGAASRTETAAGVPAATRDVSAAARPRLPPW